MERLWGRRLCSNVGDEIKRVLILLRAIRIKGVRRKEPRCKRSVLAEAEGMRHGVCFADGWKKIAEDEEGRTGLRAGAKAARALVTSYKWGKTR